MTQSRLQLHQIPNAPTQCIKGECVYNRSGTCPEPRTNKGNGDAECHRKTNKTLLAWLR